MSQGPADRVLKSYSLSMYVDQIEELDKLQVLVEESRPGASANRSSVLREIFEEGLAPYRARIEAEAAEKSRKR